MLFPVRPALRPIGLPAGGDPIKAGLKVGIVAYWKLEEASGTRVDSVSGAYDMTPTNGPGNGVGKIGNAVQLVKASVQYLTGASYDPSSTDFSMACWANRDTNTAINNILAINGTTFVRMNYQSAAGAHRLAVGATTLDSTFGTTTNGTWYLIVARYTSSSKLMELSVNAGAWNTATAAVSPTAGAVSIGAAAGVSAYNGRLDECGLWSRKLTDDEVTYLYNSGNGRSLY